MRACDVDDKAAEKKITADEEFVFHAGTIVQVDEDLALDGPELHLLFDDVSFGNGTGGVGNALSGIDLPEKIDFLSFRIDGLEFYEEFTTLLDFFNVHSVKRCGLRTGINAGLVFEFQFGQLDPFYAADENFFLKELGP